MQKQTKMQIGFSGRPDQQHKKETRNQGPGFRTKRNWATWKRGVVLDKGHWTNDEGQRTTDNGQMTKDEGQWTMDEGQWTMDNGQWTMDKKKLSNMEKRSCVGQRTMDKWRRTNDEGQMTKDKWHWTKEKGQIETEQHEKVSVKPRRGISGGSDCKDSGSCLKSRFSISGFLRLFCSVFSVSFLDWVKPKGDDMPIQCSSVLFSECKEIYFCIKIHSNHLAEHPIWRAIHLVCREN